MKTTRARGYVPAARDVFGRCVVGEERAPKLVPPELKTLEVFENRDGEWLPLTVLENDADVSQPPFDAITFGLASLWTE